ncbi:hypothetical protein A2U01_0097564, partial [Trifolium medium]|nr:hypothetical protein [Trifolium medium]
IGKTNVRHIKEQAKPIGKTNVSTTGKITKVRSTVTMTIKGASQDISGGPFPVLSCAVVFIPLTPFDPS